MVPRAPRRGGRPRPVRTRLTLVAITTLGALLGPGALFGPGARATWGGWSTAQPVKDRQEVRLRNGVTLRTFAWLGLRPPLGAAGMVPVELTAINSGTREATVTVSASAPRRAMFGTAGMLPTTTVTVPPGATVATRLLSDPWLPTNTLSRPSVEPSFESNGLVLALEPIYAVATGPSGTDGIVAITPAVDACAAAGTADLGSPWALVDREDCPADWRSWTLLDRFALTADDWLSLPEGTREAIRQWVALGGRLTVFGTATTLDGLPPAGILGIGRVDFRSTANGELLGGVARSDGGDRDGVAPETLLAGYGGMARGNSVDVPYDGMGRFTNLALRYGPRGLPVVALLTFVVLLSMAAGPLNVLVFAGRGRRARLFWTTPAITLVATAALLAVVMLRDGIGGVGVRRVLCVLVPDHNLLAVVQEQFTRTGALLGTGFPEGETAWMRSVGTIDPGTLCLEHGDGKRTGDWFRSRSDRGHLLLTVRPSRARVELVATADDGVPTLVSSIDIPLETILFRDRADRLWRASGLEAGVRKTCTPADETDLASLVGTLSSDAGALRDRALKRLALLPGHVLAVGRAADRFAIATLGSIRWEDEQVVFIGPVNDGTAP